MATVIKSPKPKRSAPRKRKIGGTFRGSRLSDCADRLRLYQSHHGRRGCRRTELGNYSNTQRGANFASRLPLNSFAGPEPLGKLRIVRLPKLIVVAVFACLQCGCKTAPRDARVDSSGVSYSQPSRESLERLTVRRIAIDDSAAARIATLTRTNSPWGSRWVACEPADTMRDGPWTTRLYIFAENDRDHCVEIEARDHANYGVSYEWLNDRLLFVRCWWGRIVSTDFVLDTETARIICIQDSDYSKITLPPESAAKEMNQIEAFRFTRAGYSSA